MKKTIIENLDNAINRLNEVDENERKYSYAVQRVNECLLDYIYNVAIITHKNNNMVNSISFYDEEIRLQVADDALLKLQKVFFDVINLPSDERNKYITKTVGRAMIDYCRHANIWLDHNTIGKEDTIENEPIQKNTITHFSVEETVEMENNLKMVIEYIGYHYSSFAVISVLSMLMNYAPRQIAEALIIYNEKEVLQELINETQKKCDFVNRSVFEHCLATNCNKSYSRETIENLSHKISNARLSVKRDIAKAFPDIKEDLAH